MAWQTLKRKHEGTCRVAQITDLHLRQTLAGSSSCVDRRSREMPQLLAKALRHLAGHNVDMVALTGDLVDVPNYILEHDDYYAYPCQEILAAAETDYRWLKETLEQAGLPYMVLPGNHDAEAVMRRVFGETEQVQARQRGT